MYGLVEIGGRRYAERFGVITHQVTVATDGADYPFSILLPGIGDFWLKGLTRGTVSAAGASTANRFLFRLGNSDAASNYMVAGTGGTTDLALDTLVFGTGQFPFVITPHIVISSNGSINGLVRDISRAGTSYIIHFAFHGSFLEPLQ
jgi:hypothetical protein